MRAGRNMPTDNFSVLTLTPPLLLQCTTTRAFSMVVMLLGSSMYAYSLNYLMTYLNSRYVCREERDRVLTIKHLCY
jgi:hypothetical protein